MGKGIKIMKQTAIRALAIGGLALAGLVAAPSAQAQWLDTGNVAQSINVTVSTGALPVITENGAVLAGSFVGSSLSGVATPWVYCVDLDADIYINHGPYPTTITTNGTVYGTAVNNAGEVAWLLDHYAATATTADQTAALQAAIWKTIYGSQFTLNGSASGTDSGVVTDYNNYLTGVGTDPVSKEQWLSPYNDANKTEPLQGLVTAAVPEPGNVALLVSIGMTGLGLMTRRRRRK
jgi:hypothetical protein